MTNILEFARRFPSEDACLEAIFNAKFGDHSPCPRCGRIGAWGKVRNAKKYFHNCRTQTSPLKDTIFYRSNLSLMAGFYAMLLFANCSYGVRSSFLRKQLGLLPKSAHRLCNRIRLHMAAYDRPAALGGPGKLVEVDEVLLRHVRRPGHDRLQPTTILGIACDGHVLTGIVVDRKRRTLHASIEKHVRPGSTIVTDDWAAYKGLEALGFNHIAVNHSRGFFNERGYSTGKIDSYWATLRRTMRGYHQVGPHNLWMYLAETECRYNARRERATAFERMIANWPPITPETICTLEQRFDWRHLPEALDLRGATAQVSVDASA
jgi:transposase-like protein